MSDELTRTRTLESLRKEAKRWLDALQRRQPEARARLLQAFPAAPDEPTLRDVQHALAQEHGFSGWTQLKDKLSEADTTARQALARYDEMVVALLDAYRTGAPEAMERHYAYTWHRRAWRVMRTYVQLDLGRQVGSPNLEDDLTTEDARYLVARDHKFESWGKLVHAVMAVARGVGDRSVLREQPPPRVTDEMLMAMPLEELTELDLSQSAISDRGMEALRRATNLVSLSLAWTGITDAGARHLQACTALRSVDLSGTHTGDGALAALAGKPALSELRTGQGVTDEGLRLLHEFPVYKEWMGGGIEMALLSYDAKPNHLLLRGRFSDSGMTCLRGLNGLAALNIDASELAVSPTGIAPLVDLPRLVWLAVDAKDATMPLIAAMPHLRFLGCQDTTAGDEGFVALSRSQTIEHIWGRRCHNLRTRGFMALAAMPALKGLSVSCLNVEDAGIAMLPSFPALRELMPMDVPDAGYRHIGRCERLESLVLMYCRATGDEATEHITGLAQLRKYFASYTRITDRTPELLATIESLEEVILDSCAGVTEAGVAALRRLPRLRKLQVSGRGVA